jgi:glycerophosphoryl diester phosphodiesterase
MDRTEDPLQIISHRGYWKNPSEKNARVALERSVSVGYGTETDVRDYGGQLVVAHDPPMGGEIPWREVVELFENKALPLAVNVKADGLADMLKASFAGKQIDWFAFDMSGPETLRYAKAGLPFFTRHSDIETSPILYERADGVWLDSFEAPWIDNATIQQHLKAGKRVCIVSPELHGRDHLELWARLSDFDDRALLCTDMPEVARKHFLI